jgi:hypothetical protein
MGDWSGDGHDKMIKSVIESNLSKEQLQQAYEQGSEKLGFDFINTVAEEYGESFIDRDKVNLLRDHGCDIPFLNDQEDDQPIDIWHEEYANIVLFICELCNVQLEYRFVNDTSVVWDIGGYGLFH